MPDYTEVVEATDKLGFDSAIAIGFFIMMSLVLFFGLNMARKFLTDLLEQIKDLVEEVKKTNRDHQDIQNVQKTIIAYEANETAQYAKIDSEIAKIKDKLYET